MSRKLKDNTEPPENTTSHESENSYAGPENTTNSQGHVISPKSTLQAPKQMHEHMSLLFLGLVEGRCKQEALNTLNQQRDDGEKLCETDPEVRELSRHMYDEMVQNLKQNGMIPMPQYAGSEGAPHRDKYLGGFDTVLGSIAKKKLHILGSNENSSSADGSMHGNSLNNALAIPTAQSPRTRLSRGSSAPELMLGETQNLFAEKSQYAEEYIEERFLGKGGYGKVVQVRSILDNCQYAVKSILISSQRLQRFQDMAQIEALLMELRTLAKLNHTNIVRYYHGWIERYSAQPAIEPNQQRLLEAGETQTRFSSSLVSGSVTESERSANINNTFDESVGLGIQQFSNNSRGKGDTEDGIVFGYSSISQAIEDIQPTRKRRVSQGTTSSAMTLKTSIESVGETEIDEADIESIPRDNMQGNIWTSSGSSPGVIPPRQTKLHDQYLYIKMSLHPMTLQKYLSSETPKPTEDFPIRHCYHTNAAAQILLAILDGIDYLHSQRIVHRDLKPANIFLSVHEGRCPSLTGSVNIRSCSECPNSAHGQDIYLTPCIGDFGLIAEIKDEPAKSNQATYKPSPLATLAPKPVGTQFYRPSIMPKTEPYICEKLDVFSLGVMAFELVNKFTTGFERVDLLGKLNKGNIPSWFENHRFARGVQGMTRLDRDQRWNCKQAREWLEELLKEN